jgi:hypothetical protein
MLTGKGASEILEHQQQKIITVEAIAMKTQRLSNFIRGGWAIAVLLTAAGASPARGATIVVTNATDSGPGSLRQAILSANSTANVPDVINFNIAGTGPFTISPLTALPALTDPVVIDGYTQPGASPNTLANGDDAVLKIVVSGNFGAIIISTSNSVVRGLAISTLGLGSAASLVNKSNVVEGNFLGLDATGTNTIGGVALLIYTPNNRVGGTTPAARNVISGHPATGGIEMLDFGSGNTVQGNFIGTDRTGTKAIGNSSRAVVCGMAVSSNVIGGTVAAARNIISGNFDRGITLDGSNNIVQGNFIGTDVTGLQPLGNARTGVEIGGMGNLVGGTNSGAGNVIAFNGTDGQGVFTTNGVDLRAGATGSTILGNSIFDNAGLGIDVNADGLVTAGFPVLTVVSNTGSATVIKGTFTPSVTFRLELFLNPAADPSGFGEGKTLLTSTNVTTDGGGNFTVNWPASITPGIFVTATGNGTTEFSQARFVTAAGRTNSWTSSTSGKWETGANWSLNVPPFIGHSLVLITNAGTKTVNNDATTATGFPSTLTISNLVIGAPAGATNTLLLAHGGTSTPLRILKTLTINSGGALVINNSALSIEGPSGNPLGVDGALTLNGGSLTITNDGDQIFIGNNGTGSFTVSNGTLQAYYPIIGLNAGANGTWNIAGGTNIITTVCDIADSLTATGMVKMTGGQLSTPGIYIGLFGKATMIVSNGIFQCAGTADIASQDGAQGSFIAAGGTSTFDSILIGENSHATGAVLVTGTALVQDNGQLDNRGTVTVSGGSLNVLGEFDSIAPSNALIITGGQFAATNDNSFLTQVTVSNGTFLARDVFLGNGSGNLGTFTVAGSGVVALPGSFNGFNVGVNGGTGILSQVGGLINLTNTALNIGGLFSPATGQMTLSNGTTMAQQVFVGGQGGGNGTATMAGGTLIASDLEVNATSQFIFNQGTLQTLSSTVANNLPFVVGNAINSAVYQLLGGTNSFAKGLRIANNGTLTGSGTIAGGVTNFGVIAPGSPVGRLNLTGALVLSNSSDVRFELGGYTPGTQFDFVAVTGGATLGGTLAVSLTNNFESVMTNGASFTVLTSGSPLTGAFANVASGGVLTTTDGYARFTVLYAGSTALRLTNLVIVDSDGDGLPDWWEDKFGLNKNNPADASLDSDGDGVSNVNEFLAGTLPNNANSFFHVTAVNPEGGNLRITWTTVGGKSYRVQTNAPAASGSLTPNFADLSPLISVTGVGESTTNFLHIGGFTNAPARYYRIRLGP